MSIDTRAREIHAQTPRFAREGAARYRNGKTEQTGVGCSIRTYFEEVTR